MWDGLLRSGLDIERLQQGGRATDYSSLGRHRPQSCGADASGAEKRWVQYTPLFFQYSSTPLRKPDRNTGEKVKEAHTKTGLISHGEGGLKDCACWSGEA